MKDLFQKESKCNGYTCSKCDPYICEKTFQKPSKIREVDPYLEGFKEAAMTVLIGFVLLVGLILALPSEAKAQQGQAKVIQLDMFCISKQQFYSSLKNNKDLQILLKDTVKILGEDEGDVSVNRFVVFNLQTKSTLTWLLNDSSACMAFMSSGGDSV